MVKKIIILLNCLIFYFYSKSQNIVSNGSFEKKLYCPKEINAIGYLDMVVDWKQPTLGTTDYFNSCNKKMLGTSQKYTFISPKDGNAYIGLVCYAEMSFIDMPGGNYREYLETKLLSPLVKDKMYCVKMYVRIDNNSLYAVDALGIYLLSKMIKHNSFRMFRYNPQISNTTGSFLNKSDIWTPIGGIYRAKGGEQFLTIGNFKTDTHTTKEYRQSGSARARSIAEQ